MINFLKKIAPFFAKCLMVVITVLIAVLSIGTLTEPAPKNPNLKVENVTSMYLEEQSQLMQITGRDAAVKPVVNVGGGHLFVIDFDGDIQASQVEQLRKEITSILSVANKNDTVLVNVETGGGTVNGYGLAASQLERIKSAGVTLVVSVDRIAASGGYMMASVADKIIAAPFAYVGSIGVVASLPNFHEVMEKIGVGFEEYTAGESKRTVGMFKENTDKDISKFNEQLERIHDSFKDHVKRHRPNVDINSVATGDYWTANQAFSLKLVDEISTSDDYIINAIREGKTVFKIERQVEKSLMDELLSDVIGAVKSEIKIK